MIEIDNITFRYPGSARNVFDGFSAQIGDGIYGLLGKNGTGKSTLLYIISGLLRPSKGRVLVDGALGWEREADMLRELFIVPEEYELPRVTLDTYVKMNEPFYPHFDRAVLDRCLADFGMTTDLRLGELSMGQKKKALMAFAIAANTKLLLMDEPTNGLDIPSKSQFRKIISEHATSQRTIIISTHQVHDIEALLTHVMIINDSRMLFNAPISSIRDKYTFSFRTPAEMTPDVIYAEPTLQGNAVIARRRADERETAPRLELLFNAVINGLIQDGHE